MISTIISAIILVAIGSEEIKGFGMTLGIVLTISSFGLGYKCWQV